MHRCATRTHSLRDSSHTAIPSPRDAESGSARDVGFPHAPTGRSSVETQSDDVITSLYLHNHTVAPIKKERTRTEGLPIRYPSSATPHSSIKITFHLASFSRF